MTDAPILSVKDLMIEFNDHTLPETAVFDFDLTLNAGEIVGIVGESGAGKSLSALAIAGLLKRHSMARNGSILFEGNNLLNCDREILRGFQGDEISVVFQEPLSSLNPAYRVGKQVEESLRIHHPEMSADERKERALAALEDAGLSDSGRVYNSYPHELSGGMRQRVMIAAAMISDPKILIADEPTTALDVTVQAQIIELFKKINREKRCAILFISHDLSLVKTLCHRVIVMKDGRIVEEGETEEVFYNPREDYTKQLIGAIPRIGEKKKSREAGETLIRMSRVDAGYRTGVSKNSFKTVLHDVSLELKAGEILGLAGESGSGKSTAARAIMGALEVTSGEILRAEGYEPYGNGMRMIFQDPYGSLNPAHTVEWILTEALTGGKRRKYPGGASAIREAVLNALDQAELSEELLSRKPRELSGGQRQRVAIAEAIISRPGLIIADEPVSALDVTVQQQIIALMERLRDEKGIAMLLISHDLRVIYRICDRVAIMKGGRIVEEGSVDRVYSAPEQVYTKELLAAALMET
ncbi:MAG: ABC transporter ATP-binding protein [Lachnospiraceae bacterium]|nr:ABC transporter ATP-binding protein [Lachnospiraceae bacterium]